MTNEELLNRRWKTTDQLLRQFKKAIKPLTKDLRNQILDAFDSVDIAFSDLNKRITAREEAKLNRLIKEWEKAGLDNDYLNYKIKTRGRYITYATLLMILLLGIYAVYMKDVYGKSKNLFMSVGEDAVKQAEKEMGRPPLFPFLLSWDFIEDLLIVQTLAISLREYLQLLVQQNAEEAYKIFLQSKQAPNGSETALLGLDTLIQKQENRVINVNGDKESGVITDTARETWNKVYIEPYRKENAQCRFIAEIDKATTKMCRGMDNMLFYTDDWNRYYRWSELDKRDVLYTTFGLKVGENLPPINNHFHWCRSTITYIIDIKIWNDTRHFLKSVRPGEGRYYHGNSFTAIDGNTYTLDGKNVVKDKEKDNEIVAEWWVKHIGGDVRINPKVNEPSGVKCADFTIDGKLIELKTINGAGKSTMFDAVHRKGRQADEYIFHIVSESKITDDRIYDQIEELFKSQHTNWVTKAYVIQGDEIQVFIKK